MLPQLTQLRALEISDCVWERASFNVEDESVTGSGLMTALTQLEELTVRARYLYTYAQLRKHPLTHAQNKRAHADAHARTHGMHAIHIYAPAHVRMHNHSCSHTLNKRTYANALNKKTEFFYS